MGLFNNIKKGVGLFKMAFEREDLNSNRIIHEIDSFKSSERFKWMMKGMKYYDVENDMLTAFDRFARDDKADNRLVHANYKNNVDEKVAYAFSKTPTLSSTNTDDDIYIKLILETLGKYWDYEIETLAFEASNKGIAWIHPYINEEGDFKMFVPPSEQIIPIWSDSSHFRLDAAIRFYTMPVWRFGREEKVTQVEVWDDLGVKYFRREGNALLPVETGEGHFKEDGNPTSWGKVPFIPFKNNRRELSDLKFVKSLIDDYDKSRSSVSDYIEEAKNFIMALKGYNGDSLEQLVNDIMTYRAIVLDADEGAGFEAITPQMDITAAKEHFEQLKKDIIESGQALDRTLDSFGSAPSGVALKFLFTPLELKCYMMESEFERGFDGLLYFVNKYLEFKNKAFTPVDVTIMFNHDTTIDEDSVIKNADNSRGLISEETILANHPWVLDIAKEKELLEKQREDGLIDFNAVEPLGGENG